MRESASGRLRAIRFAQKGCVEMASRTRSRSERRCWYMWPSCSCRRLRNSIIRLKCCTSVSGGSRAKLRMEVLCQIVRRRLMQVGVETRFWMRVQIVISSVAALSWHREVRLWRDGPKEDGMQVTRSREYSPPWWYLLEMDSSTHKVSAAVT